jgi:histidinol phosphatase-like PHP family hydrolase
VVYDYHCHTNLSDGVLTAIELIRRAHNAGYKAIALTDHVAQGSLQRALTEIIRDCALARAHWDILAIPGVELTHLPVAAIGETAQQAKELGAWLVVVHGETIIEQVEKGTNRAAVQCHNVDILAHPGLLTLEEAKLAAANNVFLELSARKGHCLSNGHIANVARQAGARMLINSDAHQPDELLSPALNLQLAQGAGLRRKECHQVLTLNPKLLMQRLGLSGVKQN